MIRSTLLLTLVLLPAAHAQETSGTELEGQLRAPVNTIRVKSRSGSGPVRELQLEYTTDASKAVRISANRNRLQIGPDTKCPHTTGTLAEDLTVEAVIDSETSLPGAQRQSKYVTTDPKRVNVRFPAEQTRFSGCAAGGVLTDVVLTLDNGQRVVLEEAPPAKGKPEPGDGLQRRATTFRAREP
jgi:hypothetical protein